MPMRLASGPEPLSKLTDALDEREPGAHRPLGVVLMGSRIAKINQHAVTHVFGDVAVEPGDRLGDGSVIGTEHFAQILGIEAGGKRGRTRQIAEHHRQLAALGAGLESSERQMSARCRPAMP